MIGATSPATVAGALVTAMADSLTGLVLSQLVRKGNPYIGGGFIDIMDMKTMAFSQTAPEFTLGVIALSDVFHYLGIPSLCRLGATDAVSFDQQCAFDYTSQLYSGLLAGINVCSFSGFLETSMSSSLEALVFADEAIGNLKHIASGLEINDETLALELIRELKPGADYLSTDHTVEHYHEHWTPNLFVRQNWEVWQKAGSRDCGKRANEMARDIVSQGVKRPLSDDLVKTLDSIIKDAEKDIRVV
jgi:trimethylamine--corrinoid protein Co-methyltransferase